MPRFLSRHSRLVGLLTLSCVTFTRPLIAADPALRPIETANLGHTDPISYQKDVRPIFEAKCTVCHSGSELKGNLDMGSYQALLKGGKRGPAIVPAKADESLLWLTGSHRKKPIMPPKSEDNPLTPKEVAVLKLWIDQGAKGPEANEPAERPKIILSLPPTRVIPIRAIAVSGNKDRPGIAASRGNQLFLLDGKTGEVQKEFRDPNLKLPDGKSAAHLSLVESLAFSPDGRTLASGSFQELTIWDAETGAVRNRVGGFVDRVVALAFSPDGALLATGGGAPTADGEVKLLGATDGHVVADIKGSHSDTVFGVAFSPDGKLLATAGADKLVKLFEVPSGNFVKTFEGHTGHVLDVGWSPDGKKLVSAGADNTVKIWDVEKGERLKNLLGHQKQVTRLAFIGNTPQCLSAGGDASVRLWNLDGKQERQFDGGTGFLYAVAADPNGVLVVSGGEEGVVRLHDGATGRVVKTVHLLNPQ